MRPAWAEVDLDAVAQNAATLRAVASPARLCAVVKADGYGHGAVPVAQASLAGGADLLAVARVAGGVELRRAGIEAELDATVYAEEAIADLAAAAVRAGRDAQHPVGVHLKVDTGMHRVGAQPADALALAKAIDADPALALRSVFTHCAVADEPDSTFTATQLDRFDAVLAELQAAGLAVACTHAANTAAAIDHPDARRSLVRVGIGLYGIAPAPALEGRVALRPALSLHARVSHVKRVAAGEGISYGLRYRPERDTTIATVPLGYADGVPRRLGEVGGAVLIGGRRCPIAGSITMDQVMVDCGDAEVEVGDEVVLIGRQGEDEVTATDWADALGTIAYEIVCGISLRVPRRYLGGPS